MLVRAIPRTGEPLAAVGIGSWHGLDRAAGPEERRALAEVLRAFFDAGGQVVDTAPGDGAAEALLGELLRECGSPSPFIAGKIRATGRRAGEAQMLEMLARLGRSVIDLVQIHNLVDWHTHIATLRAWKVDGRLRYVGVTHYDPAAFPQIEELMAADVLDFVQVPYSVRARHVEERLLPVAADHGVAVLAMLPFEAGGLVARLRGRALPPWAAEVGCTTWAQLLLKFVLSHPAVTAVVPATSRIEHLRDNLRAGEGPLPDEAMRRRLVAELAAP